MRRQGFMSYAVLVRLLTMSIVLLILLVWSLNAFRIDCWLAALVFGALFAAMLVSGSERALFHRRTMFEECLSQEGKLFNLLYSRVLMTINAAFGATALAVVLMSGALMFEPRQWSLLFADLLLLTLLIPRLVNAIGEEVHDQYRYAVARQGALVVSLALLWTEAALVLIITPPHDFSGMRWQEVVTFEVMRPDVRCGLLQAFAQVYAVGQALAIWAVQNVSRAINDPTQSVMLWVGFAVLVGFPYLIALAYSRALIGMLGRPWLFWGALAGDGDDTVRTVGPAKAGLAIDADNSAEAGTQGDGGPPDDDAPPGAGH